MLDPEDNTVNSSPQPPGSFPHATRVAAHGKQAAPFSRLLRHARGVLRTYSTPTSQRGVKSVNEQSGNAKNVVNIATDGTYNTSAKTNRKKPGKMASFAVSLPVENITDKYILAVSRMANYVGREPD